MTEPLRQIAEWKARGVAGRGIQYKGIFIGNSAYGLAPEARPDPFGGNFRKTAAANAVVALTTATLLRELTRAEDESGTAGDFWRTLFAVNGVYE